MTPLKLLKILSTHLQELEGHYAIAGGLAVSFYRAQPRLTKDVDIALAVGDEKKSKKIAISIIEKLGLKVSLGWIAGTSSRNMDPIALVIGSIDPDNIESTIDFLLPNLPWILNAVKRGQNHLIDYGFAKLPTVTPEDLILAKAFALELEPFRFQDLDDIKSILAANNDLDLIYLVSELERLKLSFPLSLHSFLPSSLLRASKLKQD